MPSRILLKSLAKRILGDSTAVNSVNSTAIDVRPYIICPDIPGLDRDSYIIDTAFRWHRANVREALGYLGQGVNFPPFKAIFKSPQYSATIFRVLDRGLGTSKAPLFICIRSEAEAQTYESRAPDLWQQCNSGRFTWPTETALYFCPGFLQRGQNPGGPQPRACPSVMANRFRTVQDMPILFANRGYEITKYLLLIHNNFDPYQSPNDPNVYMNLPLAWGAEEASRRVLSYLMYIQCGSETCSHCC